MSAKLGTLTLDLIAKTAGFTEPMKKAGDTAERESKRIENSAGSAIEMIKGLGVTALAGFSVGAVISMADEYTQMAAQIRNATSSQQEYNQVQEHLLQTANTTYRPLKEAQQVYLDVGGALKAYGETTERALRITDSLSFSYTHNATAADKAASATDAYMKSIYSGKVSGDAWISILSAVPSIVGDLSKSLNKSEADILSMGNAGKLSTKDLNNALDASREKSEALANSMENSLADGFTVLSNAVTNYLGEANESTSATGIMAGALGILAENLETVANVAMLGGVAYLTKRIAEQSIAFREAITVSAARTAAAEAEAASQARLLALDIQRSRQAVAQTLTELNLARTELNSATTRQERAAATMRLTQAEIAYNIAMKQSAVAVATQVAAESELAAARTASSRALALVGGPIGAITIGVTALAAGYMYLSDNSEKSTKSLRENNEAVGDAVIKYRELNSIQRDAQIAAERQKLEELNEVYRKASAELMVYASNMGSMGEIVTESQVELSKLFAEYKKTDDLDAFNTSVQNSSKISQDAKDKTANFAKAVYEAGTEAKTQKDFIAQLSGELNGTANAGDNAATGVRNLASALNEVNTKLSSDVFSAKLQNAFEKQGKSSQSAARWVEIYNKNSEKGFKGVTVEQKKMLDELDAIDKQREARQKVAQAALSASVKASKSSLSQQVKDAKEAERLIEQQKQARISISYSYLDDFAKFAADYKRQVTEIEEAKFRGDESTYLAKAKARYEYEEEMYLRQITEEINSFKWSEEEKLKYSHETQRLMVEESGKYNEEIKELKLKALDEQYALELRKAQWHAQELRQTMEDAIKGLSSGADDIFAKATMTPQEYSQWSLENNRDNAKASLKNQRVGVERDIMTSEAYSTDDERYQALLDAHKEYRDGLYAIDLQYDQQVKDLNKSLYEDQMYAYSSVLSSASSVFSDLTSLAKDAYGESSAAYKTMFLMQQSIAIGQATINAFLAYSQVLAQAPYPLNMTLAPITLGLGMANVGMIAGQTIAGMAHDGIDNIPKEGTWLLDGGERVLNPQQNKDLTSYLNDKQTQVAPAQGQQLTIVNQIEQDDLVGNYMRGPAGGQILINQIKANPSDFKAAMGIA